jgi:transcriptional regulator with XRE-family HTH domain
MSEHETFVPKRPVGQKIAKARKLRGMSQEELGEKIGGMSRTAVSRMENSETIADELLKKACEALDVTEEGLMQLDEDAALQFTANFYDNSTVNTSSVISNLSTLNNYPLEETIKFFEKELQRLREELKSELKK